LYSPSIATGSYATTLLPIDPSLTPSSQHLSLPPGPLRKRRQTTIGLEEEEKIKRPRLGSLGSLGSSQGSLGSSQESSFQGLEKAITQLAQSRRNVLQLAIELLETEYTDRLTSEHMQMAIDCLEIEAKSSIFISIRDKAMRDQWLERQAGVEIINWN
jgi:hypothetical protein